MSDKIFERSNTYIFMDLGSGDPLRCIKKIVIFGSFEGFFSGLYFYGFRIVPQKVKSIEIQVEKLDVFSQI